ncbi:hypothetical protein PILCRDRAFT_718765 [Piloderma croceum F 1598]|uniref:Uncharacterized protein n=1 Tax=Piloderma croceum (strain F 1598) TaxID=765440 RepID=A0A0C3B904_PILCF|nr:hypothetical protein PILCRDRAFT_718765 [Piloderma croceum F 1598]
MSPGRCLAEVESVITCYQAKPYQNDGMKLEHDHGLDSSCGGSGVNGPLSFWGPAMARPGFILHINLYDSDRTFRLSLRCLSISGFSDKLPDMITVLTTWRSTRRSMYMQALASYYGLTATTP